jgi:hypothetical protein
LFWNNEIIVDIQNFSRRHINTVICFEVNGQPWKFMSFYGNLEVDKRKESWVILSHLRSFNPMAWMCIGDFNKILEANEKFGACRKSRKQMENFRATLDLCHPEDLGFVGLKFTWCNLREDVDIIRERLDRALASEEWRDLYPVVKVEVLATLNLDHASLVLHY